MYSVQCDSQQMEIWQLSSATACGAVVDELLATENNLAMLLVASGVLVPE